jgi:2,7-dihydroxy-5-methyl-1-naphthoate 7-O-methyltransferase
MVNPALPPGADAYLLCDILHDWDDDHAHTILSRRTDAAHPTSRILVIEAVGGRHADSEFNLVMLALYGGRDRTLIEFRDLAEPHGLTLATVIDLTDQRCLLEFEPTTSSN